MKFLDKLFNLSNTNKKKLALCVGGLMFCAFVFLFYAQIVKIGGDYFSDTEIHLALAVDGKGYSILYRAMECLYKITGTDFSIVGLQCLIMLGTWWFTARLITLMYEKKDMAEAFLIALPASVATGIYVPYIFPFFYKNQIITQPYHNITYMGMRLFAVLAMLVFCKVFQNYLKGIKWQHYLLLSLFLTLSTAVKPSFFYGFALTLLLFLIFDFIKTKCKLLPFTKIFILGSVVFLSLAIMFYQAKLLYTDHHGENASSIVAVWGKNFFSHPVKIIIFKILCGLAFPAVVGIANRKKLKRTELFIYLMYGVQLFIALMFAEAGPRQNHGNFFWGVYIAAFFVYIVTYARFFTNLQCRKSFGKLYIGMGALLLSAHLASAFVYFVKILHGVYFDM